MIETLIFSKDRACQCDLLLRSLKKNLPDLKTIHVLYKATSREFSKGYNILIKKFPDIDFIEEKDFTTDTKRIVKGFAEKYSLCLVDDAVAINYIDIMSPLCLLNMPDNHCISLRLSPTLTMTYPTQTANCPKNLERVNVAGTILYKFFWDRQRPLTDFSYPSCIDGHVYTSAFFKYMIENLKYKSPNTLEQSLDNSRDMFKPAMICFEKQVVLTVPINLSQSDFPNNRVGNNSSMSLESLNNKYLSGLQISTKNIYGIESDACHKEIALEFEKQLS